MFKKHPLLLSSLLLTASLNLNGQEEQGALSPTTKESLPTAAVETVTIQPPRIFTPFTGAITGSKVRMRVNPSLEGHVVRETTHGEMFVVAGESGDYYAVLPPKGTKGYVFRTFVLDNTVEGERVNVRLYPDIDAPVIGQLNKGEKIASLVSEANNKWLEIDLTDTSRFYVAKEYVENKGGPEVLATVEKKRGEASHHLSAAALFAQAEIQKPFEQIDLDRIQEKFDHISKEYQDFSVIVEQVREAAALIQDVYVQKKVAFLEGKAQNKSSIAEIEPGHVEQLAKVGIHIKSPTEEAPVSEIASAASKTMGLASTISGAEITDKMLSWQPLEEAFYHLWASTNGEKKMEEFYAEEEQSAMVLTGIVEPYSRPVKNRPGDFLLKNDAMPVAFLYSTRVNLEKLVGQKITVLASPRPNHNFAFPAYFVITVE